MLKKMDHTMYPLRLRGLSLSSLYFIISDAQAAMRAMPDNPNNSYYADEVCYCTNELNRRKKGVMGEAEALEAMASWG